MNYAAFLRVWLAGVVLLIAVVAGFNAAVDPYEVFGWQRHAGLNLVKPATKNHAKLSKSHQVARYHPATVLVGTSRTYVGFDAASPVWPAAYQPVYNAGLPGTTLSGMRDMLAKAVASGPVRHALVILDFESFLFADQPSSPPGRSGLLEDAADRFLAVFTASALQDSVATVAAQHAALAADLRANGSTVEAEFIRWARDDGYQELFAQKLQSLRDQLPSTAEAAKAWRGSPRNMGILADILKICRDRAIGVDVIFSPSHVSLEEIYAAAGLLPAFEDLKRAVVALAAAETGHTVRVWDFTGYDAPNIEPIPTGKPAAMRYWWEPVHFTKELGETMLHRVIAGDTSGGYGTELTPSTIDAALARFRAVRAAAICGAGATGCPPAGGQQTP